MLCASRWAMKSCGEGRLVVKHADHRTFVKTHERGIAEGGRRVQVQQVPGKAGFPKEAAALQNGHDSFFALLGHDGELDLAGLNVEHGIRCIPLRKDQLTLAGLQQRFAVANFARKVWGLNDVARLGATGFLQINALRAKTTLRAPKVRLHQYSRKFLFDDPIAIAGRRFKSLPVEYGDLVATVLDPAGFLERSRDNVHSGTAHA